ncbi:hypothetical protein QVD17_31027 [Tagetes erecta]|uniref:Uncharacterized protein n=1 Tax=Tagetes erecta TaxID=13708 RepID=A0AAD8K5E3_TARER|nr:hypothetical protein QVD17_31027 [Tagetes erecta]
MIVLVSIDSPSIQNSELATILPTLLTKKTHLYLSLNRLHASRELGESSFVWNFEGKEEQFKEQVASNRTNNRINHSTK